MEPVQADLPSELPKRAETFDPAAATEVCIGGRSARKRRGLRWMLRQPNGSGIIRLFGYVVAKVLRRAADEVTFDRTSFESALARVPNGTLLIIAPSHRSYMDFLLCSYLFFDQPGLGIAIPHIAAAKEFSRIPVLGHLFEKGQAFFIKRGMRRGDYVELTARITDLVKRRQTLQVFIEGTRSRSRQFLPPRHGLLKCIQETGQPATILPIALSYDRVTEEVSFLRELQGSPKPEMKLSALSKWTTRLLRGKIKIGRVHIACGAPVKLDKFDRLRDVAEAVMGQLQAKTITTTLHLRSFLECNPIEDADLDWLSDTVRARGGRVLPSACANPHKVTAALERCMRYHWMHLFYTEARAAFPENPAIQHHISRNGFLQTPTVTAQPLDQDARVEQLLFALFGPICRDYAIVAHSVGAPGDSLEGIGAVEILHRNPACFLPDLEGALEALLKRRILAHGEQLGTYRWGRRAAEIDEFRQACELHGEPTPAPELTLD
jgi:alcohol-forming fatty acyl-CoA reductase